jgi:hypothetical protein
LLLIILLGVRFLIDSSSGEKGSVSFLSQAGLLTTNIENFITEGVDNFLPNGTGAGDGIRVNGNKSAADVGIPFSSKIPEVPTYPEKKSNVVYQKEYRRFSLNFQRAIESGDEIVTTEVFNITGKNSGYDIKDASDVFDYVNRRWEYRSEKKAEFFFGASQTINEGYKGDCDDYSIVRSALLRKMGFNTRVVTATNNDGGHAYPELYIGNDKETAYKIMGYVQGRYSYAKNIWYSSRKLEGGKLQYWLNLDWSGSNGYRHPGGVYFEGLETIYYPYGLVES